MINLDMVTKENITHNSNWPQVLDHPHKVVILAGSGSGKTNSVFNLISQQLDIDQIYVYAKDPYEAKYQLLIKKRESTGLKHLNDSKAYMLSNKKLNPIVTELGSSIPIGGYWGEFRGNFAHWDTF